MHPRFVTSFVMERSSSMGQQHCSCMRDLVTGSSVAMNDFTNCGFYLVMNAGTSFPVMSVLFITLSRVQLAAFLKGAGLPGQFVVADITGVQTLSFVIKAFSATNGVLTSYKRCV